MTMPNFLIIGAARSGTTALHYYLKEHPQIYMCPIKETNFFAANGGWDESSAPRRTMTQRLIRLSADSIRIADLDDYCALFEGASDELAIGEASPSYLIYPGASQRIRHHLPDVKLLAILRNPVDRAYSAHMLRVLYGGQERGVFGQSVRDIYWGFYYAHLKRYYDLFDRSQIQVHLYEDLTADPAGVLGQIYSFLGVDPILPDLSVAYNVGGVPRNGLWQAVLAGSSPVKAALKPLVPSRWRRGAIDALHGLQRQGLTKPAPVEPEVRAELIYIYKHDILQLQDLIQRDLGAWLELPESLG
jgi:hypothetical protein